MGGMRWIYSIRIVTSWPNICPKLVSISVEMGATLKITMAGTSTHTTDDKKYLCSLEINSIGSPYDKLVASVSSAWIQKLTFLMQPNLLDVDDNPFSCASDSALQDCTRGVSHGTRMVSLKGVIPTSAGALVLICSLMNYGHNGILNNLTDS